MRWSQAYRARYPGSDRADTADTKEPPSTGHAGSVATVRCVTPGESDIEAAFLATERAALLAEGERLDARAVAKERLAPVMAAPASPAREPPPQLPGLATSALVERMAAEIASNPAIRLINREAAMAYFRGEALRRLSLARQEAP